MQVEAIEQGKGKPRLQHLSSAADLLIGVVAHDWIFRKIKEEPINCVAADGRLKGGTFLRLLRH